MARAGDHPERAAAMGAGRASHDTKQVASGPRKGNGNQGPLNPDQHFFQRRHAERVKGRAPFASVNRDAAGLEICIFLRLCSWPLNGSEVANSV